jgi:hypothetical protein
VRATVFSPQCSVTTRIPGRPVPRTGTSARCTPSAGTTPPASAAAAWPATRATAGSAWQKVTCLRAQRWRGQMALCLAACYTCGLCPGFSAVSPHPSFFLVPSSGSSWVFLPVLLHLPGDAIGSPSSQGLQAHSNPSPSFSFTPAPPCLWT